MWIRTLRHWMLCSIMLWACGPLAAHDVPPSIVMIDIGHHTLDVELQLQLSELGSALALPLTSSPATVIQQYGSQIESYIGQRLRISSPDGRPYSLRIVSLALRHTDNNYWVSNDWLVVDTVLVAPEGSSTEQFSLDYSVILQRVVSHKALIYVRRDFRNSLLGDQPLLIGMAGFGSTHLQVDGSQGGWWTGLGHLFALGARHIASGPDHLLFLLTLLLPTPLFAVGRWCGRKTLADSLRSIVRIVTGFTVGHSLTLALSSITGLDLDTRAVEVLIAVSILVSSVHAIRPLFPGKEAWVAAAFGLVHGLAFANALKGLGFDSSTLLLSLLGFNLGIEAMQLLIVAGSLPLLILSSANRHYWVVRVLGAGFAAACALGWILERAFKLANPLAPVVNWLAAPPEWLIGAIATASTVALGLLLQEIRERAGPESSLADRLPGDW